MLPINPATGAASASSAMEDVQIFMEPSLPVRSLDLGGKILDFQEKIDASDGSIQEVETLVVQAMKVLDEEGGIALEIRPELKEVIKYLKFIVDFYVADYWVGGLLHNDPGQPYSTEEKEKLQIALIGLLRAEHHQVPLTPEVERFVPRSTYVFNFAWHNVMKAFCLIGINGPSLTFNPQCTCCQGIALISGLLENLHQRFEWMNNEDGEQKETSLRKILEAIALRGESQKHQGPCTVFAHIWG